MSNLIDTADRSGLLYASTLRYNTAQRVLAWAASPLTRLFVPRNTREAIASLAERVAEQDAGAAVEHLLERPAVGSKVRLLREDSYLQREAGAFPGSIGVVVRHSQLNWNDNGVLVDWGNGREIRANLTELALA